MGQKHGRHIPQQARPLPTKAAQALQPKLADSLFDVMVEGSEYRSIVDAGLNPGQDVANDVVRGLEEIARLRGRPCIAYLGNVVRAGGEVAIDASDDLPFVELVKSVPEDQRSVDVLLSTVGGSLQQVVQFVSCLRARFDDVQFLIPAKCMSAGTLFALSGDDIWMGQHACLGPIDPQVPTKDGRYVPAQALLALVEHLRIQGEEATANKRPIPWTAVRLIDGMDRKELGEAITASQYSITVASQFLNDYKFRHWKKRETTGAEVTPEYRKKRAAEVGAELCKHDRWKSHGHSITRKALLEEVNLKVNHPDAALELALARLWAVCYWIFEKTPIYKMLIGSNYRYFKFQQPATGAKP